MAKTWHVVKSTQGALGGGDDLERIADGLNKKQAEQVLRNAKKETAGNKYIIYWIDFDWK